MCSGVRYSGTPRPGDTFTMKTLLALSLSRSSTILAILSLASGPFQLINGWMAPYSCGGSLKLAATSFTDGNVISCQGRCAGDTAANSGIIANVLNTFFIVRLLRNSLGRRQRLPFSQISSSARHQPHRPPPPPPAPAPTDPTQQAPHSRDPFRQRQRVAQPRPRLPELPCHPVRP